MAGACRRLEMGDFVAPYRFHVELPPLPADPKLMDIEFDRKEFVKFRYDSAAERHAPSAAASRAPSGLDRVERTKRFELVNRPTSF